jgi:subtilisin-like proprotein convertase family protein
MPYIWTVAAATAISHTYPSDLDISLISPAGTKVTLSHRNGGGNDNVFSNTYWFDVAPELATDAVYQNNVAEAALVPEEAMGAFQGENGTGTWTLMVADLVVSDTGTLNGWWLEVFSLNEAPITTTKHFSSIVNVPTPDIGNVATLLSASNLEDTLVSVKLTTDITHTALVQLTIDMGLPTGSPGHSGTTRPATRFHPGQ